MPTATDAEIRRARTRALRWFWSLVVLAVVMMGALYRAAGSTPGPLVAVIFFVVALSTLALVVQAARVWLALEAPRRR